MHRYIRTEVRHQWFKLSNIYQKVYIINQTADIKRSVEDIRILENNFRSTNGYGTPLVHILSVLLFNINSLKNTFRNFLKMIFTKEIISRRRTKVDVVENNKTIYGTKEIFLSVLSLLFIIYMYITIV